MRGITFYRKKLGMTQQELAQAVGVSQGTICQYENGQRTPTVPMFAKIAQVLGVSMDELAKDEKAPA